MQSTSNKQLLCRETCLQINSTSNWLAVPSAGNDERGSMMIVFTLLSLALGIPQMPWQMVYLAIHWCLRIYFKYREWEVLCKKTTIKNMWSDRIRKKLKHVCDFSEAI